MSIHLGGSDGGVIDGIEVGGNKVSANATLEIFNRDEEDEVGTFHFYGFVDSIGVIWFVYLYSSLGWLYRGKLDVTGRTFRGTWGSNRSLWHGTFELRKS
ncbi:hypothetical protein F5X98DRAFT_118990 [Xylaria grammica]|nr:hypothetical protein F5X98DRAFT_118990 [Xylaria grammica]